MAELSSALIASENPMPSVWEKSVKDGNESKRDGKGKKDENKEYERRGGQEGRLKKKRSKGSTVDGVCHTDF